MKEVLDFVMLFGFILFLVYIMRGFFLQMQARQKKREEAQCQSKEKDTKEGN